PIHDAEAPTRALAAARTLGARLAVEVPELRAGVGVSGGAAVAGYIGTEARLEYTVIGDPINEAARLTDVAKEVAGTVAVAGRLVGRASPEAQRGGAVDRGVAGGGGDETTVVMVPPRVREGAPSGVV